RLPSGKRLLRFTPAVWEDICCSPRLEVRTHIEYNCSRNEYNNGVGRPFVRSNARGCSCAAVRPRGSVLLHPGNRARSGCECWLSSTRARKTLQSGIDSAKVCGQPSILPC